MRAAFLFVLLMAFGCPSTGESTNPDEPVASEGGDGEGYCPDDGWAAGIDDQGRECAAIAGVCCYESPDDACDALDCDGECQIAESMPAQVSCS